MGHARSLAASIVAALLVAACFSREVEEGVEAGAPGGADAAANDASEAGEQDGVAADQRVEAEPDAEAEADAECVAYPKSNQCACTCAGESLTKWFSGSCEALNGYVCKDSPVSTYADCKPVEGACPPWYCSYTSKECSCSCGSLKVLLAIDGPCSDPEGQPCYAPGEVISGCVAVGLTCPGW